MRDFIIETASDPVTEAQRYGANAKNLLEEKGQLDYERIIRMPWPIATTNC
jgi:hypothetical protein